MTNAEILVKLDEVMTKLNAAGVETDILLTLAAIRAAIAVRPATPQPLSGGGPPDR